MTVSAGHTDADAASDESAHVVSARPRGHERQHQDVARHDGDGPVARVRVLHTSRVIQGPRPR
jgi:hypothetical protein